MMTSDRMDKLLKGVLNLGEGVQVEDAWHPGNPPEWDSLSNLRLIYEIESEFGISIEFEDLLEIENWGQFKKFVAEKTDA